MTPKQFEKASVETLRLLRDRLGERLTEPKRAPDFCTHPHHLAWMLHHAILLMSEGQLEKANRWLGFVQGVMAAFKLADLEDLKRANMPEGAEFDDERI